MEVRGVKFMSSIIFEETKKDIEQAYHSKINSKIEKETKFIFDHLIVTIMSNFNDRVKGISIDTLDFNNSYVLSKMNWKKLTDWLNRFQELKYPISNLEFGKLKIDLEHWYYELGGKEIKFIYDAAYLITPSQASEKLGISNVTLNKYVKQGLECIDTTNHNKIPGHAIEIWKDPVYAMKQQMLVQKKKLRNQSSKERINEIDEELLEFKVKYKAKTVHEAFATYNIDIMDDPSEYYEWRDLEEEKENLLTKLIEDSSDEQK